MFAPIFQAVKKLYGAFLNEKNCHHTFDISLYNDFLSLIFRAPARKTILARRVKLVLLTTNQTLIFVSVLEVSGDLFGERKKQQTNLGEGHTENAEER